MSAKRILVVDDDETIRLILTRALTGLGYEVEASESGEEAIECCATSTIDLAIVDYKLPGISGLETAGKLRDQYGVPFVLLTAHGDDEVMRTAVKEGAHAYLNKPIELSSLIPTVEAALGRSADARHLAVAKAETELINVALGILMTRHEVTRADAMTRLRRICRPRQVRAAVVAEEIVNAYEELVRSRGQFEATHSSPPVKSNE